MLNRFARVSDNRFARWLADDSFPARPQDRSIYRYKGVIWEAPPFLAVVLFIGLLDLVTLRSARDGLVGYVVVPITMWALTAVMWLYTVTTAVRVRADCLVLDNWLVRHVIPWERFAGLFVEDGVGMFARLDDGTEVKSRAYARIGPLEFRGYAHMRETLERIRR